MPVGVPVVIFVVTVEPVVEEVPSVALVSTSVVLLLRVEVAVATVVPIVAEVVASEVVEVDTTVVCS